MDLVSWCLRTTSYIASNLIVIDTGHWKKREENWISVNELLVYKSCKWKKHCDSQQSFYLYKLNSSRYGFKLDKNKASSHTIFWDSNTIVPFVVKVGIISLQMRFLTPVSSLFSGNAFISSVQRQFTFCFVNYFKGDRSCMVVQLQKINNTYFFIVETSV